jgi:transcriptional regulator with XRE-family HTH domain
VNDPRSFGDALRRERERRGIALDAIAEQTKVGVALLEGLERGDLARWPSGIFRRAFVRGYAQAVGLDAASVVEAFTRVYPEDGAPSAPARHAVAAALGQADPLRLTLADDGKRVWSGAVGRRAAGAAIDLAVVALAGLVAFRLSGAAWAWLVAAVVAVGYHFVGTVALGASPGAWLVSTRWAARSRSATAGGATPESAAGGTSEAGEPRPAEAAPRARRRDRRPPTRIERYPGRPTDTRGARH